MVEGCGPVDLPALLCQGLKAREHACLICIYCLVPDDTLPVMAL